MTFTVTPSSPDFFAEIGGVDLNRDIDRTTVNHIVAALDRYAVVLFRGQNLTQERQIAVSRLLGPLEISAQAIRPGRDGNIAPEVSDISNLAPGGGLLSADDRYRMSALGNRLWHTDSSFKRVPGKYSLLYANIIPPTGGDTQFADLRAAYDSLSFAMKDRIETLVAEHSIINSRAAIGFDGYSDEERAARPPQPQRLVRFHPGSKRRTLYLSAHATSIRGMRLPEARILLMDLTEMATQREFVHTHRWRVGDLVVWDNRCTMHRARESDPSLPRDLRRTTVADHASTLDQPMAMTG